MNYLCPNLCLGVYFWGDPNPAMKILYEKCRKKIYTLGKRTTYLKAPGVESSAFHRTERQGQWGWGNKEEAGRWHRWCYTGVKWDSQGQARQGFCRGHEEPGQWRISTNVASEAGERHGPTPSLKFPTGPKGVSTDKWMKCSPSTPWNMIPP